jgi:phosphonate transport system substrate-binding protein
VASHPVLGGLLALLGAMIVACGAGAGEPGDGEGASAVQEEFDELTLGFVPYQEAGAIADTAEPLSEAMEEELGVPVEAEVLTNYIGLVEAMGNEQVDLAFFNSFGYVLAKDRYPETQVLLRGVRDGSPEYHSQFVVRSDSGIESLEDLEGMDVAFVDPASTSGYLFPMAHLVQEGLVEQGGQPEDFFGSVFYAGGHDNALTALYAGEVDAAATFFDETYALIEDEYPDVRETASPTTPCPCGRGSPRRRPRR